MMFEVKPELFQPDQIASGILASTGVRLVGSADKEFGKSLCNGPGVLDILTMPSEVIVTLCPGSNKLTNLFWEIAHRAGYEVTLEGATAMAKAATSDGFTDENGIYWAKENGIGWFGKPDPKKGIDLKFRTTITPDGTWPITITPEGKKIPFDPKLIDSILKGEEQIIVPVEAPPISNEINVDLTPPSLITTEEMLFDVACDEEKDKVICEKKTDSEGNLTSINVFAASGKEIRVNDLSNVWGEEVTLGEKEVINGLVKLGRMEGTPAEYVKLNAAYTRESKKSDENKFFLWGISGFAAFFAVFIARCKYNLAHSIEDPNKIDRHPPGMYSQKETLEQSDVPLVSNEHVDTPEEIKKTIQEQAQRKADIITDINREASINEENKFANSHREIKHQEFVYTPEQEEALKH